MRGTVGSCFVTVAVLTLGPVETRGLSGVRSTVHRQGPAPDVRTLGPQIGDRVRTSACPTSRDAPELCRR
jgi:hypothetical protein